MDEAAAAFEKLRGIDDVVVGGPTPTWRERGKRDADVVFSGADRMMTDYIQHPPASGTPLGSRRPNVLDQPHQLGVS